MALRILGAASLAGAVLMLLADLHFSGTGLNYHPTALGVYWHDWNAPSLNLLQAVVERYILPQLWSYVLLPLLLSPAWMVAAALGTVLLILTLKRRAPSQLDTQKENGHAD